ncbi:MAG: FKBP-type peptidyl-prolyl cis-trans isomerase [Bacteroidales bacterium]|nr:FKBP-type peptidyl-prolyl cis-trans isomerase [Bacteroidales bacterium]
MTRKLIASLALGSLLLLGGCIKENAELMYSNQETKIDSFVKSTLDKNPSYTVTYNHGSVRITVVEGNGPALEKKNSVSILYAGYTFNGGLSSSGLFATNIKEIAKDSGWDVSDDSAFKPITVSPSDNNLVDGLANGLVGVKEGEECIILFSGKYGFGKKQNGTISANSAIAYHVLATSISD